MEARISAVQDDLVRIRFSGADARVRKNEIVHILPQRLAASGARLMAEVLRVRGAEAEAQVFDATQGVAIGDPVEPSGELLSVALGPGLLGQVFDGLQNPLEPLAQRHGVFLPRGQAEPALNPLQKWAFRPGVTAEQAVRAGDPLGVVEEGVITHKILAPFDLEGVWRVVWIEEGAFAPHAALGELKGPAGQRRPLTLAQRWPARRPLPRELFRAGYSERLYPDEPLITGQRIIDGFVPVARGGAACIPGPFGAGKTVLQQLIARHSDVDVVVYVACGERAGEVVEMITEFPQLKDPRSGGALMDRTVIICNTSAMPVAAREASIHTGVTIAEYYRQMGLDVLLLADSTSRWAQALRETSGRLEEIPGEEAFPAYLASEIRSFYERAGALRANDGALGSLTIIGAVSPAGGNFEEPVTQATLSTVKAFLGLSAERAYKRFYPAIDPLASWSRYHAQLRDWFVAHLGPEWPDRIEAALALLRRGAQVEQLVKVTGVEGVTLEDYVAQLKAQFFDRVYLQQDAFDPVDASAPLARQKAQLARAFQVLEATFAFADKDAARDRMTALTAAARAINYAEDASREQGELIAAFEALLTAGA